MAESTYPTIGHGQINAFILPIKATTSWTDEVTPTAQMALGQVNRLTSLGVGAFDLALRKRYEVGRTASTEKVASSAVDKPVTLEWLDHGEMRVWNLLTGRSDTATSDITEASFDATSSECCIIVHKLDESSPANVIESDIIWRCVVDTFGISIPNSQDDDVRISVRLTGDKHVMAVNAAGMAICFLETAIASVVTLPTNASHHIVVEQDDWPDNDDGTNERTLLTADEAIGATALNVYDNTGFSAGQDIIVRSSPTSWETTTIDSVSSTPDIINTVDAMDEDHILGAELARTRGFFLFVYNQTSEAYLELGTDYRVKRTAANTVQIFNIDGGSAIGTTDEIWACWLVASAQEIWTDNDADLYGITHPMTQFMVSPESTFVTTTVGLGGTAVTEDTHFQLAGSGTSATDEWAAYAFTAAATGKVDNVQAYFTQDGTGIGEVYATIYSSSAGVPNAQVGNPSQAILATALTHVATASETLETFYFTDGPDLTSAATYHVVFKTQGYATAAATYISWRYDDAFGDSATLNVRRGDPNGGGAGVASWAIYDEDSSDAEVNVNLIGSQEVKRIQGMDMSVTLSRSAYFEMGSESTIERSFDETDVRITIPKMMSDNTSWSRLIDKNTSSVKTARPEQNPVVWCRLEEYSTVAKNAGDIKLVYEFPSVQRSGGEKTSPANERSTERITMTGDEFTISNSL